MNRRTEAVVIALAVVLAAVAVWGWLAWAAHRDHTGMERVVTPEEVSDSSRRFDPSPPYKRPAAYNLPTEDKGWPADWPTRHEIGLIAWGQHLDHAEVDASSMAIERQPSGEIVVTNMPEAPVQQPGSGIDDWPWPQLRHCESTSDWAVVSRNGRYHGAYQFHRPTWDGVVVRAGMPEWVGRSPADAPPQVQHAAAVQLHSERGFQPWPGCRAHLGLR